MSVCALQTQKTGLFFQRTGPVHLNGWASVRKGIKMILRLALMLFSFILLPATLLYAAAPGQKASRSQAKPARDAFARDIVPLIRKFCGGCHGTRNPMAGLSLLVYKDTAAVLKARSVWERVSKNVDAGYMPPAGAPQPTPEQRSRIVAWIDSTLSTADCQLQDPGRVTLRRLNRAEYNNTIRDLLGVDFRPADDFPSDDVGYGFDNIGDVLTISPLLMEKYLAAAEKIAEKAIVVPEAKAVRFEADRLSATGGAGQAESGGYLLYSAGEVGAEYTFPHEGEYLLRARAYGQQAGPEPTRMAFRLDGREIQTVDVKAVEGRPEVYEARRKIPAGRHRFAAAFLNDYYQPNDPDPANRDRNLIVDYLEIAGPLPSNPPIQNPKSNIQHLFRGCPPTEKEHTRECARRILANFARRAFRRPATPDEIDRLMRCVDLAKKEGESFERGLQLAVQAALVSPHFLFKVEVDPQPNNPKAKRLLGDYELASRLSYFLWSSMPDEELFALAAKKRLQDPKILAAQVRRMLKDPKARALSENFASQWLYLRNLSHVAPDPDLFPTFNETLRAAMRTETERFFEAIVKEDRSVLDFIDAKFTFLNEPLARHYGIAGVKGNEFRRVALTGEQRGGLLTQASILTVTSNPTRTSPVKRGKWVLDQLLGAPPPPPPPGVSELKDEKPGETSGTLRQRMEQHRKNPACASCHARMDPIGFGLENYDAVGAWRTHEGKLPIDSSGTLPGGQTFRGPAQLKAILKSKTRQFVRCLAEKMLTYALGRGLESYDKCAVDDIVKVVQKNGYRFSALVTAVVQSEPFRKRRGDGGPIGRLYF